MEHPAEPAALLGCGLRRLILGDEAAGDRERQEDQGDGTAHERELISKRCKSCQTLYQSAMQTIAAAAIARRPIPEPNRSMHLSGQILHRIRRDLQ
jgi:hypothetical protein